MAENEKIMDKNEEKEIKTKKLKEMSAISNKIYNNKKIKGSISNTYNVLLHLYGYFKKDISKDEKTEILDTLEEFKNEVIPLIAVIKILNLYIKRFNIEYLKTQKFLNPYPKELALRSKVEAYR